MVEKEESGLTAEQQAVVLALVDCRTVMGASKATGTARSTIYSWLQNVPEFRNAVGQARAQVFEAGLDAINGAFEAAVKKLEEALNHGASGIRLKAAIAICKLGLEMRANVEVEGRLKALEERAGHLLQRRSRT